MSAPSRCVLVDGDPEFMALVRLYLVRVSPRLEIVSFSCPLEAMGFLDRHHADLLITDFRMPLLDGLRLTRHLSQAPDTPGARAALGAPIDHEQLLAVHCLQQRQLLRAHALHLLGGGRAN